VTSIAVGGTADLKAIHLEALARTANGYAVP
jgi:hypothetical protein